MTELAKEALKYINNEENLKKLLLLEKKRRKISKDDLCFICTSNISGYWWCDIRSYYLSRCDERKLFGVYMYDKIRYAEELGLIENLPEDKKKWLDIGNEITLKDINRLLRENKPVKIAQIHTEDPKEVIDKFERGRIYEFKYAEDYPTIRWHFNWGSYVIEAVPDGITDDFVYEFKSTASKWLSFYTKPVALTQADLYGYFFKRENKRVQIYLMDKKEIETIQNRVDKSRALDTLKAFDRVCSGVGIRKTKIKWKCRNCEVKEECIKEGSQQRISS